MAGEDRARTKDARRTRKDRRNGRITIKDVSRESPGAERPMSV